MFYIYILYSVKADKYYVGHTDDPVRRLIEHNNSKYLTYTSKYRPWTMEALFKCGDSREKAIKFERLIKKQKSKTFLRKLISDEILFGNFDQLVRVPHVRD